MLFKEEFNQLSEKERLIVTTMAHRKTSSFAEISKCLNNKVGNLVRFLSYLEKKAILEKKQREYISLLTLYLKSGYLKVWSNMN